MEPSIPAKREGSMNRRRERHTVDMLFVLTLFAVFAVSASLLIAFGASIYEHTIDSMDEHYNLSTASAFITEKLHQHDEAGSVAIGSFGDGDALVLTEVYGGKQYSNYIYIYDGYLKELFTAADVTLSPESGVNILPVKEFNVRKDSEGLVSISLSDSSGRQAKTTVYIHSENE